MANKAEIAILVKMRDEASRTMGKMAGNIERHAGTIRKAGMVMAAFGAALAAALIASTKSAINQELGIKRLDLVLQKIGMSYADVREDLEKQIIATQRATSFGDELQREVLGKLIPVFGNYEHALMALPLILDAVAFSEMSAETVVRGLGRALAGQVNTAVSVGLQFEKTMGVMERFAFVESKIGGLAEGMVNPFEQVENAIGDLAQAIAGPLIKPMTEMLQKFADIALKLSNVNPGLMTFVSIAAAAAGVLATFAGAMAIMLPTLVQTVKILKSWAAVQAVITALTGPMGIAIAAAAIGVGFATAAAIKSFQFGGVVPGPVGQPQLAVVHGGETITPAESGGAVNVNFPPGSIYFFTDDRALMRLATLVSDAQRRRSQGTVGVNP